MKFEAEYFPMGFSLKLATNSAHVLAEASRIWSRFPKLFDHPSVRLKVVVADGGARPNLGPVFRAEEDSLSFVADSDNFASANPRTGCGYIFVAREVAADPPYFRYHFLEPLAYVLLPARHFTLVHASCVALKGRAILLCGGAGAGKTCLAFACARQGWTFLSGDATAVIPGPDEVRVVGRPFEIRFRHTAHRLFAELEKYTPALRPSGKTDIEVDPRELNLPWAPEASAGHLVFLDRIGPDGGTQLPASIEPFPRDQARLRLEEASCFGDQSTRLHQRRTLDALLRLPVVRLRYSDLASAERALRSLLARAD